MRPSLLSPYFFFFSSRRRHTRFSRDWSSDVCSSDLFTRDPSTGEKVFYGDYLVNAQGEDVVAGIRTPMPLREMAKTMPKEIGRASCRERCRSRGSAYR